MSKPPSSSDSTCQHLSIANSKIGEVMVCPDCGVVHLSMQSMSIRFDLDAFAELAKMIKQAKATLDQAQKFASDQVSDFHHTEKQLPENSYHYHQHKVH